MRLGSLPSELVELVIAYCDVQALLSLRATSRSHRDTVTKALARIVDTAGSDSPNSAIDRGLPSALLRALLTSRKHAADVIGLVVRETRREVSEMRGFRFKENVPIGFEEADEFILQHRRLSLISHADNVIGKGSGRQIDAYRPQNAKVQAWLKPEVLSDLPNLKRLCILNRNSAWMPRNLPRAILDRLTWLEIEVDGVLAKVTDEDLDAIATHCKQLTHLRIVSSTYGPSKEAWLGFVNSLEPNKFRVLDLVGYPHLSTEVWKAIYDTQRRSLRAGVFFQAPDMIEYIVSKQAPNDNLAPFSHNIAHLLLINTQMSSGEGIADLSHWFPNVRHLQISNATGDESSFLEELPQVESIVQRGRMAGSTSSWLFSIDAILEEKIEADMPMPDYKLSTVHLVWESVSRDSDLVDLLTEPNLHTLSIKQGRSQESDPVDPNDTIQAAMDTFDSPDSLKPAPGLRVLRLLFWRNAINIETVRKILDRFPRLGSLQLCQHPMAAEDVAAIRVEFGERRVGFESMDHGEMDITHGVLTLNGQSIVDDPGQPRWTGDEDDPNFVEDLDEVRRLTGFSYPYYGEAGWD